MKYFPLFFAAVLFVAAFFLPDSFSVQSVNAEIIQSGDEITIDVKNSDLELFELGDTAWVVKIVGSSYYPKWQIRDTASVAQFNWKKDFGSVCGYRMYCHHRKVVITKVN